jgi:hypothetical protein
VRLVRIAVVLAVATGALAVPLAVLSSTHAAPPTFSFGRTGGNIIPAKVTIGAGGKVTATSGMHVTLTQASKDLRNGLGRLAKAEGFWTESTSLQCAGVNPDIASRFITVSQGGKSRTVTARGACYPAFEELYAVLSAAVGAGP